MEKEIDSEHFLKIEEAAKNMAKFISDDFFKAISSYMLGFEQEGIKHKKRKILLKDIEKRWEEIHSSEHEVEFVNFALPLLSKKEIQDAVKDASNFDILKMQVQELQLKLDKIENENEILKEFLFETISNAEESIGIQYFPVEIYLDTDDSKEIYRVYQSVIELIESIDFEQFISLREQKGSWYKRFLTKSKNALSSEEVTSRLKELEYGVEVNTILKPQSEVDLNQSVALLNIIKSVENVSNAAIRIGSLLVVKTTDFKTGEVNIVSRSLSINELHFFNKHPDLVKTPQSILSKLANAQIETILNGGEAGKVDVN